MLGFGGRLDDCWAAAAAGPNLPRAQAVSGVVLGV